MDPDNFVQMLRKHFKLDIVLKETDIDSGLVILTDKNGQIKLKFHRNPSKNDFDTIVSYVWLAYSGVNEGNRRNLLDQMHQSIFGCNASRNVSVKYPIPKYILMESSRTSYKKRNDGLLEVQSTDPQIIELIGSNYATLRDPSGVWERKIDALLC